MFRYGMAMVCDEEGDAAEDRTATARREEELAERFAVAWCSSGHHPERDHTGVCGRGEEKNAQRAVRRKYSTVPRSPPTIRSPA
jgi:hypothetical protein